MKRERAAAWVTILREKWDVAYSSILKRQSDSFAVGSESSRVGKRVESDAFVSTPVPLMFERFYQPDVIRVLDKIVETLNY